MRSIVEVLVSIALLAHGVSWARVAEAPPSDGAAIYQKYCQLCHGANLEGYAADNAPSLVSPTFRATASDDFLRLAIARGRVGTAMAGYGKELGGPLTDEEVDSLIVHLRGGTRPSPLSEEKMTGWPDLGERLYSTNCESCHGTLYRRGKAVHLANPMFLDSASDAYLRVAIADGRPGTPMEAWQSKVTSRGVNDLIAYLRSLARPVPPPGVATPVPSIHGTDIVLHPEGGPAALKLRDGKFVSVAELARAYDEKKRMVIIDARANSDYLRMHIEGAVSMPYYDFKKLDKVPNDGTWVITYCACPHHLSGILQDELRRRGYKNTAVLDEGVFEWQYWDHPMVVAPGQGPVAAPPR